MSRLAPAAEWLSLGASPTFATMAVATTLADPGPLDMLCAPAVQGSWPLDPMATMYLLMSAFHVSPWLRRLGRPARRSSNKEINECRLRQTR